MRKKKFMNNFGKNGQDYGKEISHPKNRRTGFGGYSH
jgi:hypothetical protein